MPLRSPERRQRQTAPLRRRLQAAVYYDPYLSSSSATEHAGGGTLPDTRERPRSARYPRDQDDVALETARERSSFSLTSSSAPPQPLLGPEVGPSPAFRRTRRKQQNTNNQKESNNHPQEDQYHHDHMKTYPSITLSEKDFEILEIIAAMADQATVNIASPLSESLNFSHLYGAFEAFMTANRLTPQTYPTYHTIFMALLHLSSFLTNPAGSKLLTWRECVSLLVRAQSDKELFRAKMQSLRDKLTAFEDDMRERFLSLWYFSCCTLTHRRAHLTSIADACREKSLPRSVLNRWLIKHHTLTQNMQRAEAGGTFLARTQAMERWRTRLGRIEKDENFVNRLICKKYLRLWAEKTAGIINQSLEADDFHNDTLVFKTINNWRQNTAEAIATTSYNQRIVNDVFDFWKMRTANVIQRDEIVTQKDDRELSREALRVMALRLKNTREHTETADDFYTTTLAQKYLKIWAQALNFKHKLQKLKISQEIRAKKTTFRNWNRFALESCEARNFSINMPCRRMLKTWRLKLALVKVVRAKNIVLAKGALKVWRFKAKESKIIRRNNTKIASLLLSNWREYTNYRPKILNECEAQVESSHQLALTKSLFDVWRLKAGKKLDEESSAGDFYDTHVALHAFEELFAKYDEIKRKEELAMLMDIQALKNQSMEQWKLAFVLSRRRHRENLLKTFISARENKLNRLYLTQWLDRLDALAKAELMAEEILKKKTEVVAKRLLGQWLARRRRNITNMGVAEKINEETALYFSFTRFWSRFMNNKDLIAKSNDFQQDSTALSLNQIFKVWNIRVTKIGFKKRSASDFFERLEEMRTKAVWKHWKHITQEIYLQRLNKENLDSGETVVQYLSSLNLSADEADSSTKQLPSLPPSGRSRRESSTISGSANNLFSNMPVLRPEATSAVSSVTLLDSFSTGRGDRDMTSPTLRAAASARNRSNAKVNSGEQVTTPPGTMGTNVNMSYALETPTRSSRIRRPVPMTSISRWKLSMKRLGNTGTPQASPVHSDNVSRLTRPFTQATSNTNLNGESLS